MSWFSVHGKCSQYCPGSENSRAALTGLPHASPAKLASEFLLTPAKMIFNPHLAGDNLEPWLGVVAKQIRRHIGAVPRALSIAEQAMAMGKESPHKKDEMTKGMYDQSPSTKSLGTPYTPHCTDLGCSSNRHPLGVIAGESRMNGSLWG